jgi:hypothetical protein
LRLASKEMHASVRKALADIKQGRSGKPPESGG